MHFFLSELLRKKVLNKSQEKIGVLKDVVVTDIGKTYPAITGIIVERGIKKDSVFIPSIDLANITPKKIQQSTDLVDLTPFTRKNDEVLLAVDVYDKQIVDIDDRRLTRVNDLQLEYTSNHLRLKGVDVSVLGVFRRLNIPNFGNLMKSNIVDWSEVQFLGGNAPVKFKVQYKNLESLHPVDIARIIIEGPGYKHGGRVLSSLKDPIAADIIEELSPVQQRNLIESMKLEDVADVIEHMPPDKSADLLQNMGTEFAEKVLPLIKKEETQKIKSLLSYPPNSTGAYMTTDYLVINQDATVADIGDYLEDLKEEPDFTTYIYVIENKLSTKLVGVVSTHDCLKADKRSRVASIMTKRVITAQPMDHIKKSLRRMYRYNVSAIPVVNKPDHLLIGILTFRDAISVFLPKRWKNRIRQVFSSDSLNH
ncbi:magnesium transporter [Candidatus Parcubacteria bacterium]|nr:MAG: magnesium transporter [Candidatus Parcubacteria bacterium]